MRKELAYTISSWSEISKCLSNNSRRLHLKCITIDDDRLSGQCIQVVHEKYGCLFACMVSNIGGMLDRMPDESYHMIPTQQILDELEKFGFIIDFQPDEHISGKQLEYLITLNKLGYDKIRILYVSYPTASDYIYKQRIVVFNVDKNPNWLTNTYVAKEKEFIEALNNGSAMNITEVSQTQQFEWEFLNDKVLNISDILQVNSK